MYYLYTLWIVYDVFAPLGGLVDGMDYSQHGQPTTTVGYLVQFDGENRS